MSQRITSVVIRITNDIEFIPEETIEWIQDGKIVKGFRFLCFELRITIVKN